MTPQPNEYQEALEWFVSLYGDNPNGPPIKAIMKALQAGAEGRILQWQPIEAAPKDGTNVLLYGQYSGDAEFPEYYGGIRVGWWDDYWTCGSYGAYYEVSESIRMNPTHWMPLPTAPQQDKGE